MKLAKDKKLWIPDNEEWQNWCLNYEIKHWNTVVHHIENTNVALDIGAHVGIWSRRMARIFNYVYAFEPIDKHIECYKENLKDYNNVEIHQIALSDKDDVKEMKELDFNSGSSTLEWKLKSKNTKHQQKFIDVKTTTLDSFNFTNVDFIKMDVEGHEINAIKGAEKTLTNNSPLIFIEVLHKELKKSYTGLDALKDLGYSQIMHVGSGNYIFKKI
jgi:FkbM family methyltransferase